MFRLRCYSKDSYINVYKLGYLNIIWYLPRILVYIMQPILKILLILIGLVSISFATAAGNVTCGQVLDTPNSIYTLNASTSINNVDCFDVRAENVTIECNDHSITGDSTPATYGVTSNSFNTTVKDCSISGFESGVFFNGVNYGTIENTTSVGEGGGAIVLQSSSHNIITHVIGTGGSTNGLYIYGSNAGTPASDNVMSDSSFTATDNALYLYCDSGNDDCVNRNMFYDVNASTTNQDAISLHFSSGNVFSGGHYTSAGGEAVLTAGTNNLTLEGMTVVGGITIDQTSAPATVIPNLIQNNNILSGAYPAITLSGSSNNIVTNNTLYSDSNEIDVGAASSNNLFYWNNFTNTGGLYANDANGNNYYNTTIASIPAGNVWYNVLNGSVSISGTATSPFPALVYGSYGSGYPYNNTNALGKLSGDIVDYAPLTPFVMGNLIVNSTVGGIATGNNSTFVPPKNLTIIASPSAGYYFFDWTTNCNGSIANSTSPNTRIQVNDIVSCYVQANFLLRGFLTVNTTVGGTVIGNNSAFTPPATLPISAFANSGYAFRNWDVTTGNCTVNSATSSATTVLVNDITPCNVQANFYWTRVTPTTNVVMVTIAIVVTLVLIVLILRMNVTIENLIACLVIAVIVIQIIIPYLLNA